MDGAWRIILTIHDKRLIVANQIGNQLQNVKYVDLSYNHIANPFKFCHKAWEYLKQMKSDEMLMLGLVKSDLKPAKSAELSFKGLSEPFYDYEIVNQIWTAIDTIKISDPGVTFDLSNEIYKRVRSRAVK